jgi:tRNA-specific 2-thiouridylase
MTHPLVLHDPWENEGSLHGRTVLLAMSGGVDSSAAAVVLLSRGARVLGLTMKNFCYSKVEAGPTSCCSASHLMDARRVCDQLGIQHFLLDTTADFERAVMGRFADEYDAGRTPNPCVDCNQSVRFPRLLAQARGLGADLIATGHYVRLGRDAGGRHYVCRATDTSKDQSYFLHGVPHACLEKCVFPLGGMLKAEVREVARGAGLAVADKPESQEICFLPDGNRAAWLEERRPAVPGTIVALDGRQLGTHAGIERFTVGQRHGLGVSPGHALYVHHIEASTHTVVLGDSESIWCDGLEADRFWMRCETEPASRPGESATIPRALLEELRVQVRYRHPAAEVGEISVEPGRAIIRFATSQRAVAPGQAVVLYAGDAVVGGGRIAESLPRT